MTPYLHIFAASSNLQPQLKDPSKSVDIQIGSICLFTPNLLAVKLFPGLLLCSTMHQQRLKKKTPFNKEYLLVRYWTYFRNVMKYISQVRLLKATTTGEKKTASQCTRFYPPMRINVYLCKLGRAIWWMNEKKMSKSFREFLSNQEHAHCPIPAILNTQQSSPHTPFE